MLILILRFTGFRKKRHARLVVRLSLNSVGAKRSKVIVTRLDSCPATVYLGAGDHREESRERFAYVGYAVHTSSPDSALSHDWARRKTLRDQAERE